MAADVLSDALAMVRLTGAVLFRADLVGPWGIASDPRPCQLAPVLPAGTSHVIAFHVVLHGECWFRQGAHDWFRAPAGNAVVLARGDAHQLGDARGRPCVPMAQALGGRSLLELRRVRIETGARPAISLLCGFLGCDCRAFEPLFVSLPAVFSVALGERIDALVNYAASVALEDRPGAQSLRVRLTELLFMEALRLHIQSLPQEATGWFAGLRDPLVGRALHILHGAPTRPWSVEALANTVGSSRSSLAARFREVLGEPPMRYLTRLRMQLAARHLHERGWTLDRVADEVGYDSPAAFQRAFKRAFGVPPATWRERVAHGAMRPRA